MNSVYGSQPLDYGEDMYPIPLGNLMRITSFVDACLGYFKITGKSITGIIHLINQTPIKYFVSFKILWKPPLMVQSLLLPSNALNKSESYRKPQS